MCMTIVESGALDIKVPCIEEFCILGQKRIAACIQLLCRCILSRCLEVLQREPQTLLPIEYAGKG